MKYASQDYEIMKEGKSKWIIWRKYHSEFKIKD